MHSRKSATHGEDKFFVQRDFSRSSPAELIRSSPETLRDFISRKGKTPAAMYATEAVAQYDRLIFLMWFSFYLSNWRNLSH